MSKYARTLVLFLIACVTTMAALFAAEAFLHHIGYDPQQVWWGPFFISSDLHKFQPDSEVLWAMRPNTSLQEYFGPEVPADQYDKVPKKLHTTDQYGLRINGKVVNHAAAPIRVLVLGDSYTYGHGVNNNESVVAFLQQKLQKDYPSIDVINAGVQGYDPEQEYLSFQRLYPLFHPQLVIWNLSVNDLHDMLDKSVFLLYEHRLIHMPGWLQGIFIQGVVQQLGGRIFKNSLLYNLIMASIQRFDPVLLLQPTNYLQNLIKVQYLIADVKHTQPNLLVNYAPAEWYFIDQFSSWERQDLLRQEVLFDSLSSVSPYYINANQIVAHNESKTASLSAINKGQVLDDSLFLPESGDGYTRFGYRHLSVHGNEVYANVLYDFITAHHLIHS